MSVSDLQSYLLKYKKALAAFVALSLLLCAGYIHVSQKYTAETCIKYPGEMASSGLTENGRELNPYEISDAIVVKRALESMGIGNTNYNAIRKGISVKPVILSSEEAKYASYIDNFSSYNNTESNKPHPVYYTVSFTTKESPEFAESFLCALMEQYRIYYVEKYAYSDDMTQLSEAAVLQYDYYETAALLEEKIRSNMGYLNNIIIGDTDFRSAETGYSMQDLVTAYDALLRNDLADVSRLILEEGISKDGRQLKITLQNRADNALLQSNMYTEKAESQKGLMEIYSEKNAEYVRNTSRADDDQQHLDIERDRAYSTEKTVYDQLVMSRVDNSIMAQEMRMDSEHNLAGMGYFSDGSEQAPQIETQLSDICGKYNTLQALTETTISDYNHYKSARYLANVSGIAVDDNVSGLIYYASTLVLSLGLGVIAVVFLELKRKKKI